MSKIPLGIPPVCDHPDLRPMFWDEPKPEPCEMSWMGKGTGWWCPVCKRAIRGRGWELRGKSLVGRLAKVLNA